MVSRISTLKVISALRSNVVIHQFLNNKLLQNLRASNNKPWLFHTQIWGVKNLRVTEQGVDSVVSVKAAVMQASSRMTHSSTQLSTSICTLTHTASHPRGLSISLCECAHSMTAGPPLEPVLCERANRKPQCLFMGPLKSQVVTSILFADGWYVSRGRGVSTSHKICLIHLIGPVAKHWRIMTDFHSVFSLCHVLC